MTTLQTPAAGASELRIGLSPQSLQATYVAAAAPVNPPDFTGQADVYSVGNGTTPPTLVRKVDPGYSDEARAAKYSGTVLLSVVVGTDGRADEVRVVKSLGMGLDEKAVLCVRQWAFQPGTHEGVPVRVRAQVEINFQLL
jgi:TonB family protein